MSEVEFHRISFEREGKRLEELFAAFQLTVPENTDDNLGMYRSTADGSKLLIGCGFLKEDMIQGIVLDQKYQGEGLAAKLMTELIKLAAIYGKTQLYVITKPKIAAKLKSLGLRMVAEVKPEVAFLEFGADRKGRFQKKLREIAENSVERIANGDTVVSQTKDFGEMSEKTKNSSDAKDGVAAIVMNCNPFTKGHQYLIRRASEESARVYVIVVEEDRSEFSFRDRLEMVKAGVESFPNVTVIAGDRYAISSVTFPSYFTKENETARVQSELDAEVFCQVFVPALGITRRYVGEEPIDPVTACYNEILKSRLPKHGVEVVEIPRKQEGGKVVSASEVRKALREGNLEKVRSLVPDSTWNYLVKKE